MAAPVTVGLTGGVAAGKSEALAALGRLGAATLSADAVVHELLGTTHVRDILAKRWGDEVKRGEGVDRGAVAKIVFNDPLELAWLEQTLHPLVGGAIGEWLSSLGPDDPIAVIEVPLLFETGMDGAFDETLVIIASEETRQQRAAARGTELVEGRDARQLTQDEKAARADHVIRNDGDIDGLEQNLSELIAKLGAREDGFASGLN